MPNYILVQLNHIQRFNSKADVNMYVGQCKSRPNSLIMRYTYPSIWALLHLINRNIADLRTTNGRESHGVMLMRRRIFSRRQADSIKHAWMTLTNMLSPARLSLRLSVTRVYRTKRLKLRL